MEALVNMKVSNKTEEQKFEDFADENDGSDKSEADYV